MDGNGSLSATIGGTALGRFSHGRGGRQAGFRHTFPYSGTCSPKALTETKLASVPPSRRLLYDFDSETVFTPEILEKLNRRCRRS
jgi:hypothetical protein